MPNTEGLPQQVVEGLMTLYHQDKLHELIQKASALAQLYPGAALVHEIAGATKLRLARFEEALANFGEAIRLEPDAPEDFKRLALELATNPDRLEALKAKLVSNRLTTPLFDPALFARHIERAFEQVHERRLAGLAPDHIHVV